MYIIKVGGIYLNRLNIIELLLSKEQVYNLEYYLTVITDELKKVFESKDEEERERCYQRLLELSKED